MSWDKEERRRSLLSTEEKELLQKIHNSLDSGPKFFGLRIPEILILFTAITGIGVMYSNFEEMQKQTTYLIGFAKNSDSYHSTVIGTQFEQGKPSNPSYDPRPIRDILNKSNGG